MGSDDENHVPPVRRVYAPKKKTKNEVVFYTNFEEVLEKVNPFGLYQIFCFIVILYASIEWAGNSTFMYVLGSLEPNWKCTFFNNKTTTIMAPTDDAACKYIRNQCAKIEPERDGLEFFSIVAQFKLICADSDKPKWIDVILAGGSLVGSVIGGHVGDHFGRQTAFFVAQLLIIITSMMSTASQSWIAFASIQCVNCFLYGVIETTSLTMMMEITSNRYRVIMVNAFQWPIAYMTIALIAFLTKGWQNYFVFLNLVSSPLAIAFMLFLESPRWLIARNNLSKACDVLNDIAHQRWNNTHARFTNKSISAIHKQEKQGFYWFYHLFSTKRLAKQSFLQILSVFTYAMVSNTYLYIVSGNHESPIMFTFLDGLFRLFTPFIIIFLDLTIPSFGRKIQFLGSLLIEAVLFGVVIVLVATGTAAANSLSVTILIIITTMINDCIFWINIIQITAQRYPTVIRCIAFGSLHSIKHIGSIVGFLILRPLLTSNWPTGAFVIPEALIIITFVVGFLFQPETKGKALMDQMVEANYGRLENELPRALIRLAAGHKVAQSEVREKHRQELEAAKAAARAGHEVDSPWVFRGDSRPASAVPEVQVNFHHLERFDDGGIGGSLHLAKLRPNGSPHFEHLEEYDDGGANKSHLDGAYSSDSSPDDDRLRNFLIRVVHFRARCTWEEQMIRLPAPTSMKEMFGGDEQFVRKQVALMEEFEARATAGADAYVFAAAPLKTPEVELGSKEQKEEKKEPRIDVLIYRRYLSRSQPCAACGALLDVHTSNMVLACAHVVHPECADFMTYTSSCSHCDKIDGRTPFEQLCVYLCCLQKFGVNLRPWSNPGRIDKTLKYMCLMKLNGMVIG
ncbi:unnamed protein product [Caenorhabditis auriculariae]|uniref:Major facilitator superfamily (MFS) profile domain-containing protein n=1 Tax=Caenorhabditis auriculariae TaxID=2777116 RepID=A0A8S1GVD0_9PELO|nr:unnamed protein product [Caenorhabditis auriculariae]